MPFSEPILYFKTYFVFFPFFYDCHYEPMKGCPPPSRPPLPGDKNVPKPQLPPVQLFAPATTASSTQQDNFFADFGALTVAPPQPAQPPVKNNSDDFFASFPSEQSSSGIFLKLSSLSLSLSLSLPALTLRTLPISYSHVPHFMYTRLNTPLTRGYYSTILA